MYDNIGQAFEVKVHIPQKAQLDPPRGDVCKI